MSGDLAAYVFQPVLFHDGSGRISKVTAVNPLIRENYTTGSRGKKMKKIVMARVRQAKEGETDRATYTEVAYFLSDLYLVNANCANPDFVAVMVRALQGMIEELGMGSEKLLDIVEDPPVESDIDAEEEIEEMRKNHWEVVLQAKEEMRKGAEG